MVIDILITSLSHPQFWAVKHLLLSKLEMIFAFLSDTPGTANYKVLNLEASEFSEVGRETAEKA